ncbi:MBL fold metallo-hydrolase [Clostridium brassicae]|uniref:MBL fold metallo-hydrolase n=1 Tax=Clostridium brassicae TaxID=2999072 RepID=A0ABT4D954_9CLOT|nr:MBL fold metallo-hydrolase [Clostridium brassicae]MCY6958839.1 MBL fold metallo-hydrolase [Clostridium brassicae]
MIKVLASGSKGNCYIIQAGEEKLLLECGIDWRNILKGLNYNIKGVKGCLISHKHSDHCRSFRKVLDSITKIYAPLEVAEKYNCKANRKVRIVQNKDKFLIGNFTILAFNCQHTDSDGAECENLGYLIQHPQLGKILFATDTYYLKYKFKNVDHALVECNYSEKYMEDLEPYQIRTFKSHMSLETLKDTLKSWDLSNTKTITLIHLSENNGNPAEFKKEIESLTGIPTYVAEPGLEIS